MDIRIPDGEGLLFSFTHVFNVTLRREWNCGLVEEEFEEN